MLGLHHESQNDSLDRRRFQCILHVLREPSVLFSFAVVYVASRRIELALYMPIPFYYEMSGSIDRKSTVKVM